MDYSLSSRFSEMVSPPSKMPNLGDEAKAAADLIRRMEEGASWVDAPKAKPLEVAPLSM